MPVITTAAGVDIGYEEAGEGDAVLMIPATGVSHAIFLPGHQLQRFSSRYRVIAVDNRGTGASSRDGGDYGAAELADDAVAVLQALGVERAHVVGLSMGSAVAQHVALRHPEAVRSLVLYNTWAYTDEYLRRHLAGWTHMYATAEPRAYGEFTMAQILSREFVNGQPQMFDQIVEQAFAAADAASRDTCLRHIEINRGHDTREQLPGVEVPALVLTGESDRTVPAPYSIEAAQLLPNARYELLLGAGASHGIVIERADEVNALTLDFLATVD